MTEPDKDALIRELAMRLEVLLAVYSTSYSAEVRRQKWDAARETLSRITEELRKP